MTQYNRVADIRSGKETVLWRGAHPVSDRRLTVKEPAPGLPTHDRPRVVSQLQREFRFLEQLSHDRIVRPVQWDEAGGRILLEDTQGNLNQLLAREGRLDVDLVARVLAESLAGLAYLHDRKLAHGGLCTWSVLIGPRCDVKLGDFTGYRLDQGQAPIPPEYLLKYRAPELLHAAPTADPPEVRAARIDLYALGFLGCELLAGQNFDRLFWPGGVPPAEGDANWLWWHGDPTKTLPPLGQVLTDTPESMLNLLAGMIQKDPARRPRSARDVLAALDGTGLVSNRKLPALDPAQQEKKERRKRAEAEDEDEDAPDLPENARRVVLVQKPALELWPAGALVPAARFKAGVHALVGRGKGCRFQVLTPDVSEKHALFLCQDTGQWWVYDLQSRTGVWVNGAQVRSAPLPEGTEVVIGGQKFTVSLLADAPPDVQQFQLVRRIHAGDSGELYLARWRLDGRPAAVRVFPPTFATNTQDIQRFLRGIPEAGELRHPNLVALYRGGFIMREGRRTWFLATEYLPGGSLRDRLKESSRPIPVDEVVRVGIDVCKALATAADRRLVHRNVNPACILFAADGTAKLGDFFLLRDEVVQTLHQITRAGIPNGESVYQSPEVLTGKRELSAAADLYSLAACLYHALTRRPPFEPDQPLLSLVDQIKTQPVVPPRRLNPAVSDRLEQVLLSCLEKEPERRPAGPTDLLASLTELLPAVGAKPRGGR